MEQDIQHWVSLGSQVGFPIAVAWFVLTRMNGKLEGLTNAVTELNTNITLLVEKMRG